MSAYPQQYKRSHIWFANLGSNMDSEMSGHRPVVILQNDIGNTHSPNVIVSPITSQSKNMPTHIHLDPAKDGVDRDSYVLTEHILTLSKKRLIKPLSKVHPDTMTQIEEKLMFSCGIQLKHPSEYKKRR